MRPITTPLDAFLAHVGPLTWDDLVAGYDFGLLTSLEIQMEASGQTPSVQRLRALEGAALRDFEPLLWAACAETTGKTPRPGTARWSQAQDRWRVALLRELLATEATSPHLAWAVERLYEQVGCPEDMLLMLKPSQGWSGTPPVLDPSAIQRFLDQPRGYGAVS
jgi:hypothetical protein